VVRDLVIATVRSGGDREIFIFINLEVPSSVDLEVPSSVNLVLNLKFGELSFKFFKYAGLKVI